MNDENRNNSPAAENPSSAETNEPAESSARSEGSPSSEGAHNEEAPNAEHKLSAAMIERVRNTRKRKHGFCSKDELMAQMKELAASLGRAPTLDEFCLEKGASVYWVNRQFGNFTEALKESGIEGQGAGYEISMRTLFTEWAVVARKVGRVPTLAEFERDSRFSRAPLRTRFGGWRNVAPAMLEYATKEKLDSQWGDVMDLVRKHCDVHTKAARISHWMTVCGSGARVLPDRPLCGEFLGFGPMAYAPRNEAGVLFLFGALAERLHFSMVWVGTEFPDCQGMREVEPGRWQYVKIEIEFESRNFRMHAHDERGCDLLVCWIHNWKECPLEVIELRQAVSSQQSACSPEAER